jgi:hypothetical protein
VKLNSNLTEFQKRLESIKSAIGNAETSNSSDKKDSERKFYQKAESRISSAKVSQDFDRLEQIKMAISRPHTKGIDSVTSAESKKISDYSQPG